MYISKETEQEIEMRLRRVLKLSKVKFYDIYYTFQSLQLADFPDKIHNDALAIIKDDNSWSQLIPSTGNNSKEDYALFRFHFPEGIDNSGFVGWLASYLKQKFGTGVFVCCGFNKNDGGIYDYWGCPSEVSNELIAEIKELTKKYNA